LLNINSFYWLASRSRLKPYQVWGVLGFLGAWWIWAQIQFGPLWLEESASGTNIAAAIMVNMALKLWIAVEAGRQLAEDSQAGAFELLLSTPLTGRDIIRGQWLALRRQFLGPAMLGGIVAVLFLLVSIHHSPADRKILLWTWLGGLVLFIADVGALGWTAMYSALTSRGPHQASMATVLRILLAPSLVCIGIFVLTNLFVDNSREGSPAFGYYLAWWLGLGFITDLIFGLVAFRQLTTRFRQLACHPGRSRRREKI